MEAMDKRLMGKCEDRTRAFRKMQVDNKIENDEMIIEGYAANFEQETILFKIGEDEYKEVISRGAFDKADMSDVVLNYNHGGKVIARTRNNTLALSVDKKGLKVTSRLQGTEEGRKLFEEIKGGYIDKMSFQFRIADESFDEESKTWTIKRIEKVYDVSAVDFPAYDTTEVSARSRLEYYQQDINNRLTVERNKKILLLKLSL